MEEQKEVVIQPDNSRMAVVDPMKGTSALAEAFAEALRKQKLKEEVNDDGEECT